MTNAHNPGPDPLLAARILVVIPSLNEEAAIEACLRSLLPQDDSNAALECLIVDGGSQDDTRRLVRQFASFDPRVKLIDNPHGDQANGVNLGAQHGAPSRDILIRCDAHAEYPDRFILNVAERLLATEADSLVVPMDAVARPGAPAFAHANAFIVDTPLGSGGSAHRGGTKAGWIDHGHHAGFLRDRFLSLGGYDPDMVGNEDAEYDTRLVKAGGRVWIEPSLRIRYFPRETPARLFQQYRRYGAARAKHLRHHRKWPKLRQLAPVIHVALLALSLAALGVSGWALSYPIFYASALVIAMVYGLAKERRSALTRVPLALGTMHLAWGLGFLSEILRKRRHQT